MNESGVERGNGGETSNTLCGKTHEPSARKLPTNHDHEGGSGRSSNISVINRRQSPPRPLTRSLHGPPKGRTEEQKRRIKNNPEPRFELAGSFHINVAGAKRRRSRPLQRRVS